MFVKFWAGGADRFKPVGVVRGVTVWCPPAVLTGLGGTAKNGVSKHEAPVVFDSLFKVFFIVLI